MMKNFLWILFVAVAMPSVALADDVESAIKRGKDARLRTLLAEGADVNKTYGRGRTGLHIAAERGKIHAAELFLVYGANMNVKDSNGDTPLHLAVNNAQVSMVKLLMEMGADYRIHNGANRDVETHAERSISEQRQSGNPVILQQISEYISKAKRTLPPPRVDGILPRNATGPSPWGETDSRDTLKVDLAKYPGLTPDAQRRAAREALEVKGWMYLTSEPDREIGTYDHRKKDREYRAEIRFQGNQATISYLRGYSARSDDLLVEIQERFRRELDRVGGAPLK